MLTQRIACSAGGFGGFFIFRVLSRHFGFAGDWEKIGARMSVGVGGGEGKINRLPAEAVKFKNASN